VGKYGEVDEEITIRAEGGGSGGGEQIPWGGCGFLRGRCLIWGALCPSKSGLMNKHIVKQGAETGLMFLFFGALFPSKTGPQTDLPKNIP
jgi:hypothetical protein